MARVIGLLFGFIALCGFARSASWTRLSPWLEAGEDAGGSAWYLDPTRSDFSRNPAIAWIRVDHSGDRSISHYWTERLGEIDCAAHSYRILVTTHSDRAGRLSSSDEGGPGSPFVEIVPGSIFEAVANLACAHGSDPAVSPDPSQPRNDDLGTNYTGASN
jgi:hypothetical protein